MVVDINTTDVVLMSCMKEINTWYQVLISMALKTDIAYVMLKFTINDINTTYAMSIFVLLYY